MPRTHRDNACRLLTVLAVAIFCVSSVDAGVKRPALKPKPGKPAQTLNGLPLIFAAGFEMNNTKRWEPTDKTAWKIIEQEGNHVYSLIKKRSTFNPPVRSPYNRSLIRGITVGSFVLDVRLQSTIPEYGHRDLCLFFGYQDDAHLPYVHLGKEADDHANQIFIVNDKPRLKISITSTPGTNWDDNWHHARVVRDVKSGTIEVFFDDMEKPVMTAVDKTFIWGRVGIGSFDDTGNFDHVLLYGEKVEPGK